MLLFVIFSYNFILFYIFKQKLAKNNYLNIDTIEDVLVYAVNLISSKGETK